MWTLLCSRSRVRTLRLSRAATVGVAGAKGEGPMAARDVVFMQTARLRHSNCTGLARAELCRSAEPCVRSAVASWLPGRALLPPAVLCHTGQPQPPIRRGAAGHAPRHTIPYHTIPYHTIPYHTIPYHTMPYHTIPYHSIPYHPLNHPRAARPCPLTLTTPAYHPSPPDPSPPDGSPRATRG
jgi:hypothetical protein